MLWLYRILFFPVLLISAPYYLLRMRKRGGYRRHFRQRLGAVGSLTPKHSEVRRIWIQAVSVGEMLAIGPILEAFRKDRRTEFYLTTTTSTGYKLALEKYQELTIGIGYFPIDWWTFSARAWTKIAPDLVILTEGERWPEHINQAAKRGVPVLTMNARMSDRSYRRMRKWTSVTRPLFGGITRVLACSEGDAARFRELGFPDSKIIVTGNIKLDLTIEPLPEAEKTALRAELGLGSELVLLGSSTWAGEEAALVKTLSALRSAKIPARLLIVPRHAERRKEVETVLRDSGFMYHFRSRGPAPREVDILVADTTGELRRLTQVADLVFVGKSLPPHDQGQTPVEAVALGKPILFGPGMSNFRSIAKDLVAVGAARSVANEEELKSAVAELLTDPRKRADIIAAGAQWHVANQGAVKRTLAVLSEEIKLIGKKPYSPLPDSSPISLPGK
jgi:3-deoxy-D-manno-octulosonic-acid transferase